MGTKKSTARVVLAIVLSIELGTGLQAQRPDGGVVVGGSAQISTSGTLTRIDQTTDRAIIDWRSFGIGAGEQVLFLQPSARSATLNRVTGAQASVILGRLDANGQVLLINPNGIVFGGGAQVNVGGLVATTSNMSNTNFMAGRLVFDQPGRPGAGILNAGAMTAAEGGLIALVAPHVRNDGVIVARLGRVVLGAADTFTVDLYGDGLIDLALSDVHAGLLHTLNGAPVTSLITQAGTIDTAGGKTVLMTASNAKSVLDNLINMSGTIKADAAVEQGGRILLLGEGGQVNVSGSMSAQGATGGSIDVLGGQVHLASTAALDASGANGGGAIHAGGAFQGGGDTYRSTSTTVDAGATLKANALDHGNGGEVVVWSDGRTEYAGAVEAKGGANGGNGGRMEVSGKGTLAFLGQADASAAAGQAGSLLLDPTNLDIDATTASVITRVLRTGTSTTLAASNDISVNSAISGGDRLSGGGLTLNAGNNINVNDFIVTNNGAVNLFATQGTVNIAPGKAIFAGNAPISVSAGGSLHTGLFFTGGALAIASTGGSVIVDSFIDGHAGTVNIHAAGNVDINQPIVNLAAGDGLDVTAGNDINVNAQVDGRGGVAGGAVTMTASNNLHVNDSIVTNNGAVNLVATNGSMNVLPDKVLVAGTGAIAMSAHGDVTTGGTSGGAFTIASAAGAVNVNGLIDGATGATRITAGTDVNINQSILNGQSGSGLTVGAGRDVNVNALIDGLGGVAGGAVALTAGRNLNLNESLATNNGAVNLTATGGTETVAAGKVLFAGSAPIVMRSAGDLTTGPTSGGSLSATSTGGSVNVNGIIDGNTGRVDLNAANNVLINAPVLSPRTGNPLTATAGNDVIVNAQIDGRGGATGGAVTLTAGHNVAVNNAVITNNGAIGITATGGAATVATGAALVSGNGAIAMTAGGDVTTSGISGGSLSARSTGGSVNINGVIDASTGGVDLTAAGNVNVNQAVLNMSTGAAFNATAGGDINVNAQIDGRAGVAGGAANLNAGRNVTVNAPIATNNGAINLFAANGTTAVLTSAGLFAGTGAISLNAFGNITTGLLTGGPMSVLSRAGSVTIGGTLTGSGGAITIGAAGQVDVAQGIFFPGASPLTITAGTNINVNAEIDGRSASGVGGAATLTAGQNIVFNNRLDTQNAAINVTATNGAVTTAANQGLFAGSGAISEQSALTLSQGITSTTGTVTLRSTAGSVNVDTGISAETGAVTIAAATDVNVNQTINNNRTDAPLSVTAGHDINVNAAIDGRDLVLPGSSGTVTMTAGNSVNLNQSITTRDSAIALTATGGAITPALGMGLFAGSGAISETSGATLNAGITETTGALTLRSTGGGVNVNTPIDRTTGAVNIAAATTVNVNQPILNLKSGNNLSITAGTDINVLAEVDGRSSVAGGTATMTAGNNLNLTQFIATNDGAVSLTATNGSVIVPTGTETALVPMQWTVSSGSAPISITSGADFTLASPVITTGALNITSTSGNVTIAAPIPDTTGAVTITAGNGLIVHHDIKSADQAITLNAGAGGIVVNPITDFDQTFTSPVNAGAGNLTLNSVGNVSVQDGRGISSTATVTIDTRGQILTGSIGNSTTGGARPQTVILNADGGIVSFSTALVGSVIATSSGGSITLAVESPGKLRITTGTPGTLDCPTCDINVNGLLIGPDVGLNAGGSVNLGDAIGGTLALTARSGDVNINQLIADQLTATAGRDILLNALVWMGNSPTQPAAGGPMTLTAGRDIVTGSPIHISNGQTLTLTAAQNLTLNLLETLGAVNITATNGNVTLNNDIGPHIVNPLSPAVPDFNPGDLGVASLSISAPSSSAAITMQGARAEGNVTISTGGTLTAAKQITSVGGTASIFAAGGATLSATPIGTQNQVIFPPFVSPTISPGPKNLLPTPPNGVPFLVAGLPGLTEISVAAADQNLGTVVRPGSASGLVGVPGTPGSLGAPAGANGAVGGPTTPTGPPVANAPSETDSNVGEDTASALRAATQACDEGSGKSGDTGLDAVAPAKKSAKSGEQANASCAGGSSASPAAGGVNAAPAPAPAPIPIPPPAPAKGASAKHR
jgi:filamentous hemagglutinin family protein